PAPWSAGSALSCIFFFQAEDGIRDRNVTGVQTCALPISDRLSWLVIGAVMFLPPAVFAATQMGHVRTRITCWLDPLSSENYSACEQISQGLFGLANGGITGAGLGEGRPDVVPHAESDFIFASFAEELGMVGAFALLLLYLL